MVLVLLRGLSFYLRPANDRLNRSEYYNRRFNVTRASCYDGGDTTAKGTRGIGGIGITTPS